MGFRVYPAIPIVRDATGRILVKALRAAAKSGGQNFDADGIYMVGQGLSTSFTTILTTGAQRTVLTEFSDEIVRAFKSHCDHRLREFWRQVPAQKVGAVVIGHIHADRSQSPGHSGGITERIIDAFHDRGVSIFANLGSSQYLLGYERWQSELKKLVYFQLDIDEMREFCRRQSHVLALEEILDWFRAKCTVVITLERLGAVAQLRGSPNVVLAWPYVLDTAELRDATGAGDALMAGVVAAFLEHGLTSDRTLRRALENGRLWAAYACTTLGGASECPTRSKLADFQRKQRLLLPTECRPIDQVRPILRILDRAWQRWV